MTRQTCININNKRHSIQVEETTDQHIVDLIAYGYGKNLTEVIRHAIREVWKQENPIHTTIVMGFRNSRDFGWAFSTSPTGEDAYSIETPHYPMHEGSLNQIAEARKNDRTFNSLNGVFYSTAWFYNGKRIIATWSFGIVESPSPNNAANMNSSEYYDACKYGWTWVPGFQPPDDEPNVKLLIE